LPFLEPLVDLARGDAPALDRLPLRLDLLLVERFEVVLPVLELVGMLVSLLILQCE
jgi:hypothetical protein